MDSMEDLVKKLGWIAWCLTIIGWFLSPIITLLVNKIFEYLVFDASRKIKELENEIIRELKKTLGAVEEQTVLRAAEDIPSQSDLKILDNMKMDLKSALYEAEDILDLLNYRRIEKGIYLGEDGSRRWVEHKLDAARAWIARCKESSFGQWMHVTVAVVMKRAKSMIQQGQSVIQGWWHSRQNFDLFSIRRARAINNADAAILQCALSWYKQLGQLFKPVILRRPGVLLPVSINSTPQSPSLESRGPMLVTEDSPCRPPKEMGDEEEIGDTQLERGEAEEGEKSEEIEEESCEGGEVGETLEEETEEESCDEEVEETSGEAIQEDDEEAKEGETTSWSSILQCCARSMLKWFAKAYFYRDWSYGNIGIKSDKKDGNVPITERIRLRKQIKSIEDTLTSSKKSNLLNLNSSSTAKDDDKENSRNSTAKNSDKDSSKKAGNKDSTVKQKEIDKLYRSIEQKVFGREEDRADISKMLREGAASSSTSKPYSVIGIYGITGSGKTTLAQYVCDYEEDAGHFNLIMFVLVGKIFSISDIFCEMLDQIKQQRPSDTNDPEIQKTELKDLTSLKAELEKELHGKCFLLVLDDLWVNADNTKERGILLDVLNSGQTGSRILVTAQKKDAGAALGAQEKMQMPIPDIEEDQYLSMFMYYAIEVSQVKNSDYERYEAIGRKITKKLGGSPIAARTVAARLKSNNSIHIWERTSNFDVLNETMGALWWSYQQLGGDIRRCFTYCRIFPKGYKITRDELVPLWIAQGFVNTRNNATEELEDIGQSYFDQLLTFSFLQVDRTSFGRETGAFTIHDLLHELAERVSGSEFYRIVLNSLPKDIPRGVHHLSIETNNAADIAEKILDLGNLHTLIIKEPLAWSRETVKRNHDLEKLLERLFMRLTKLRVLIIKLNNETKELSVAASIVQMKHLRYLGIHYGLDFLHLILPSTFSKVYHIQTIDIPCSRASCPEDMANLIYLRHFSANKFSFPNIGRLTALQTLKQFEVKEEPGHELKQLMHLNSLRGTLYITGFGIVGSAEEAAEAHLNHKKRLRILKLRFGSGSAKRVGPDVEAEVVEGLCPPTDIQELQILNYGGSKYPSWMLSRHRPDAPKQLHRLELWYCSQLASIPEGSELFIVLRELRIYSCDWDSLPENMERLVSLQTLEILCCANIEHIPTLPQALKTIKIHRCHMLRSIGIMDDYPRLEFILEKEKRLEACTSQEYCQDTAPTGTPEQSPYPMIPCPCLVTLGIYKCANLVTLPYLPPSLKILEIRWCGELCSVSGQLGQLEKLHISNCHNLQSVDSLGDASSLETLSLDSCQCLASLGSSGGPGSYLALQRLVIKYCPAMDMKQFNKNVLDGLVFKDISYTLSSNPDERKPLVRLNRCSEGPCTQVPGREVIFRSHELDDQPSEHEALNHILSNTNEEPIGLSYAFLKNITNDFSQEIGRGGFGVVYTGFIEHKKIAVKKLYLQKDLSDKHFLDELKCLRRVKHKNIVRFLGYCSDIIEKPVEYNGKFVVAEEWRRFLCFEYVPNKSLHDYLKDESHGHEWDIRYQLINGICQGLCYLHNKERIIHLDLKPENILLDDDMVPKIADFGISRLFTADRSRIITKKILGSRPYMAPEYLSKGEITFKCDIFSLGVILEKLLLGNNDFSNDENWHQSPDIDNPQLKRCIEVAQMCVNEDPSKRPTIDCIINMLSEQN